MTATDGGEKGIPNSIAALACTGQLLGGVPEASVSKKQRAALIASVALWSLRERRAVAVSLWEHRVWWWSSLELMVLTAMDLTTLPEIQSRIPFRSSRFSLEQELLKLVRSIAGGPHKGPDSRVRVRDVIEQWLGDDYEDPHRELIERVTDQAKTAGLYEQVSVLRGNPISRFLLGPKEVNVPILARATELETAGLSLAARWRQFTQLEPDFSSSLITTVADAIDRRKFRRDWD